MAKTIEELENDILYGDFDEHIVHEYASTIRSDQHKKDIEKACEWIRRNTEQRTDSYGSIWVESDRYETQEGFIKRFKRAMKK